MTGPEDKARELIDRRLQQAGWVVQDMAQFNPAASRGVAVREFPTDTGPADYVLLLDREPVGVIEAKRDEEGQRITEHEAQTERYANATLKWRKAGRPLRFLFEATGQIIRFTDGLDPLPRSRELFLVDTQNLGKQAHQEFMAYQPADDARKFTELYGVQRLASPTIDPHAQLVISTIQRMYSVLSGEPIEESAADTSLNKAQQRQARTLLVRYSAAVTIETFDAWEHGRQKSSKRNVRKMRGPRFRPASPG